MERANYDIVLSSVITLVLAMWYRKILPALWRLDGFRLPNDGVCPWCGHQHAPTFGRFICDNCQGYVADNDLSRKMIAMSGRQQLRAVAGGVVLAIVVIVLGLAVDELIDWLYRA